MVSYSCDYSIHGAETVGILNLKTAKQDPAFKEEREKQKSISALL